MHEVSPRKPNVTDNPTKFAHSIGNAGPSGPDCGYGEDQPHSASMDGSINVNRAPSASDKTYSRAKKVSLRIHKSDLLVGASDADSGDSGSAGVSLASRSKERSEVFGDSLRFSSLFNPFNPFNSFDFADRTRNCAKLSIDLGVFFGSFALLFRF